jgi:hypothetical protein
MWKVQNRLPFSHHPKAFMKHLGCFFFLTPYILRPSVQPTLYLVLLVHKIFLLFSEFSDIFKVHMDKQDCHFSRGMTYYPVLIHWKSMAVNFHSSKWSLGHKNIVSSKNISYHHLLNIFCFGDKISLCGTSLPLTHYIPALRMLGLQVCTWMLLISSFSFVYIHLF